MFRLVAISLAYIFAVVILTPSIGTGLYHLLLAMFSGVFVLVYLKFSKRVDLFPLVIVFVITVLFPVAVLLLIGRSVYGSWSASLDILLGAYSKFGKLWGLEIFLPFFVALGTAFIFNRSKVCGSD